MNAFDSARSALAAIRRKGFEAWLVGGAVRDHLLGLDPTTISEFDIVTSASPDEVMGIFRSAVGVGRAFGVVRVRVRGFWFEVATFRSDADDAARSRATIDSDAGCRDFTINAIYWDPDQGLIHDPVGGQADLERKVIRAVGNPDARLGEDPVRALRAVRFGSWDGFNLDPQTRAAVSCHAPRLTSASAERIHDELSKISVRPEIRRGEAWRLLESTGIAAVILPAALARPGGGDEARILDLLPRRNLPLLLAVVLRRSLPPGTPPKGWRDLAVNVVRGLKGPWDEARLLGDLLAGRARYRDLKRLSQARRRLAATRPEYEEHEALLAAEGDAPEVLGLLEDERRRRGAVREEPLLDGTVLLAAGVRPGPLIGRMLRKVRVLQLSGRLNDRPEALRWLGLEGFYLRDPQV